MQNKYLIGIISACFASLIWASSFIGLKIALKSMPPMSIIFFRMLVASIVFGFFYKKFKNLSFTKSDIKYIILMVVCEPGLYFVFEIKALEYTSASQAGVITSTMPLLTAIGAGIFLKEIITKEVIIGSLLAMIGAIWLSLVASVQEYAPNPLLGNTLEAFAMICAAGYALSLKHLTSKFSAIFLTAIQAFGGMIFFFPLVIWEWQSIGLSADFDAILAVLYLGIAVTMGGYGLFNYALSLAPASKIVMFVNLIPVFTVLLAFIILGEKLSKIELLASSLVFLGVFISQKVKLKNSG